LFTYYFIILVLLFIYLLPILFWTQAKMLIKEWFLKSYISIKAKKLLDVNTMNLSERWVVCLCNEPMAVQSARHDSRLKFLPIT